VSDRNVENVCDAIKLAKTLRLALDAMANVKNSL
jgi:hypothetical protein